MSAHKLLKACLNKWAKHPGNGNCILDEFPTTGPVQYKNPKKVQYPALPRMSHRPKQTSERQQVWVNLSISPRGSLKAVSFLSILQWQQWQCSTQVQESAEIISWQQKAPLLAQTAKRTRVSFLRCCVQLLTIPKFQMYVSCCKWCDLKSWWLTGLWLNSFVTNVRRAADIPMLGSMCVECNHLALIQRAQIPSAADTGDVADNVGPPHACKPAFPQTMPNATKGHDIIVYSCPLLSYEHGNYNTISQKSHSYHQLSHVIPTIFGTHKYHQSSPWFISWSFSWSISNSWQLVPSTAAPEGPADPPGCSADPGTGEI
jgi:hypothetical protein